MRRKTPPNSETNEGLEALKTIKLQETLFNLIGAKPGECDLRILYQAFDILGFSEQEVRHALRELEREGRIKANWDWLYEPTE